MERHRDRERQRETRAWCRLLKPQSPSPMAHLFQQGHAYSNETTPFNSIQQSTNLEQSIQTYEPMGSFSFQAPQRPQLYEDLMKEKRQEVYPQHVSDSQDWPAHGWIKKWGSKGKSLSLHRNMRGMSTLYANQGWRAVTESLNARIQKREQPQSNGSPSLALGLAIAAAASGLWLEMQIHHPQSESAILGKGLEIDCKSQVCRQMKQSYEVRYKRRKDSK